MKFVILIFLIFPILSFSQEYSDHVLSAKQIIEIVEEHLVHTKKINLNDYTLKSVSYDYLKNTTGNHWFVFYEGKPNPDGSVPLGHHFGVKLTNSKKPEIEFISGI